ncbi:hypothetical protein K438DRAFT_1930916 [Mycena galopus ATCC 62051]|nr:hypothetical protein K438DRAFT_1930916 [Mycena galopus ATCC 62051]
MCTARSDGKVRFGSGSGYFFPNAEPEPQVRFKEFSNLNLNLAFGVQNSIPIWTSLCCGRSLVQRATTGGTASNTTPVKGRCRRHRTARIPPLRGERKKDFVPSVRPCDMRVKGFKLKPPANGLSESLTAEMDCGDLEASGRGGTIEDLKLLPPLRTSNFELGMLEKIPKQ